MKGKDQIFIDENIATKTQRHEGNEVTAQLIYKPTKHTKGLIIL